MPSVLTSSHQSQLTFLLSVLDIPKDAPQPFSVKNLQPGAAFALWMTAATKAGESPRGNEEMIYIKSNCSRLFDE